VTSALIPRPVSAAGGDAAKPPLRELRGVVERITYQNPDNGYTVARLAPERTADSPMAAGMTDDDRLVTLVGTLADLTPGEAIQAHGWWRNDPKHGWHFQAQDYRTVLPATLQGMKKYLGSGLVKGVGPVLRLTPVANSSWVLVYHWRAANRERRVLARGVPAYHSLIRTRLRAAAVATCCRRVFARPM